MTDLNEEQLAAFILTHGRPDKQFTETSIRKAGFTGPIFYLVDDEDPTRERYEELFPGRVEIFSKAEIAKTFDEADNFSDRRSIVYARNACFDAAERRGFRYFIQLDDDYTSWWYTSDHERKQSLKQITSLDRVLAAMLDYFKEIPAASIAFAQGGDIQGGWRCTDLKTVKTKRKAMNSFICDVRRRFTFSGRINEDVNTYITEGRRGDVFLQIYQAYLVQRTTQTQEGGMTDIYKAAGTYVKSFYTILFEPSCVSIAALGQTHTRLHHKIDWRHAVPKILSEAHRKPS